MFKRYRTVLLALSLAALGISQTYAGDNGKGNGNGNDKKSTSFGGKHVLLISIDGMHALDYENCVASNTCPFMAALGKSGVTYPRTSTSKPSDSFPGLLALVTGGSPKSVGGFYDVAYDRILAPPAVETGNGNPPGMCIEKQNNGTTTEYEEGDEIDQTKLNGGFAGYSLIDGGILSLDPAKLIRDPFKKCAPVYPWNFIRTNSIYGVIHDAGGYTAWSDKHAVYALVSGHSDGTLPVNVDDYYSPEVNSNIIALPAGTVTALGDDCSSIIDPTGGDWTTSFVQIRCYDQLKVNAVVNWIKGKHHLGDGSAPVPVIFGMNFQAVSVGQKLIENGVKGGYMDAAGDPTPNMLNEIEFADAAIGQMVTALKSQGLFDSTTIIITAKHGQSPIDFNRFFPIPGHSGLNGITPSTILFNAGLLAETDDVLLLAFHGFSIRALLRPPQSGSARGERLALVGRARARAHCSSLLSGQARPTEGAMVEIGQSDRVIGGPPRASERVHAIIPRSLVRSPWRTVRRRYVVRHHDFGARHRPIGHSVQR